MRLFDTPNTSSRCLETRNSELLQESHSFDRVQVYWSSWCRCTETDSAVYAKGSIIFILGAATGTEHKRITSTVISHGYLKPSTCSSACILFYSGARMFLAIVYESTSFSINLDTYSRFKRYFQSSIVCQFEFRRGYVFFEIISAGRSIAREGEPWQGSQCNIKGSTDPGLKHTATPYGNFSSHTKIVYLSRTF